MKWNTVNYNPRFTHIFHVYGRYDMMMISLINAFRVESYEDINPPALCEQ